MSANWPTDQKRPSRPETSNWFILSIVALLAFTCGFVTSTLMMAKPRYTTFAGCLMAEMQGRQEKLIKIAAQLCHEKVAAGEIRK